MKSPAAIGHLPIPAAPLDTTSVQQPILVKTLRAAAGSEENNNAAISCFGSAAASIGIKDANGLPSCMDLVGDEFVPHVIRMP